MYSVLFFSREIEADGPYSLNRGDIRRISGGNGIPSIAIYPGGFRVDSAGPVIFAIFAGEPADPAETAEDPAIYGIQPGLEEGISAKSLNWLPLVPRVLLLLSSPSWVTLYMNLRHLKGTHTQFGACEHVFGQNTWN